MLQLVCLHGWHLGAIAGAFTTPLDVAKTRLQTQGEYVLTDRGVVQYRGMIDAVVKVFEQEGMRGLTRGLGARVLFHSMSASLAWTTYVPPC